MAASIETVIALGSNLGNRAGNLHQALKRLRELGVQVLRHSALYETAPAYVIDQPAFLNAAILATTQLPPLELLRVLKQVEAEAGRDLVSGPRFGPRPLDLDIVFYGSGRVRHEWLEVPHPRWQERPFVMAPVSDLLYRSDQDPSQDPDQQSPGEADRGRQQSGAHASTSGSCSGTERSALPHIYAAAKHWRALQLQRRQQWQPLLGLGLGCKAPDAFGDVQLHGGGDAGSAADSGAIMRRVTPLTRPAGSSGGSSSLGAGGSAEALLSWGSSTLLMGILNITPDSFSTGDGRTPGVGDAVAAARALVADGAQLLDVGGQSTRPGAARLSAGEEAARVVPVIRALRQCRELRGVALSVDTFYADVARQAVLAGADMVNDVSGGSLDPAMFGQVAALGVPYVLMHMRGDPTTMASEAYTSYGCVWRDVGRELMAAAARAEAAGVPAWSILLDPGLGFAKTAAGSLELMRHLPDLRAHALSGPYAAGPLLVGPSRKRFLGGLVAERAAGAGSGLGGSNPHHHRVMGSQHHQQHQVPPPAERDTATVAAAALCVAGGADVVRVHAVRAVRDALAVADAVCRG